MSDPESRAAETLAELPPWLWDGHSLPVPVEDIADTYFGLHVCESEDLSAVAGAPSGELSGLLVVDAREVWLNAHEAKEWPGRRRFTLGHELGHWVLHRAPGKTVFCREPDAPSGIDIEEQASQYAGALLFPAGTVAAEWEAAGGDLAVLGERFGASLAATERAVFREVRRPRARTDAECFYYDDAGYEAWRDAHPGGFVVSDQLLDFADGRLHVADCSHLTRAAQPGRPRTRAPKWCSDDLDALRRDFPEVGLCKRCGSRVR
jgi:hypothetical protein